MSELKIVSKSNVPYTIAKFEEKIFEKGEEKSGRVRVVWSYPQCFETETVIVIYDNEQEANFYIRQNAKTNVNAKIANATKPIEVVSVDYFAIEIELEKGSRKQDKKQAKSKRREKRTSTEKLEFLSETFLKELYETSVVGACIVCGKLIEMGKADPALPYIHKDCVNVLDGDWKITKKSDKGIEKISCQFKDINRATHTTTIFYNPKTKKRKVATEYSKNGDKKIREVFSYDAKWNLINSKQTPKYVNNHVKTVSKTKNKIK